MKSNSRFARNVVLIAAGLALLGFGNLSWGQVQLSLVVKANSRIVGYDPNKTYVYQICVGAKPEQLSPVGPPKLVGSGALGGLAAGSVTFFAETLGITDQFYVRVWFWEGGGSPRVDEALAAQVGVGATPKYRFLRQPTVGTYNLPASQVSLQAYPGWQIEAEVNLSNHLLSSPMAFSADKLLIAFADGSTVHLYDVRRGIQLNTYFDERLAPDFVALSHSAEFLLAVSRQSKVAIVWDSVSGKPIASFTTEPLPMRFAADDRHLLADGDSGNVPVFTLPDRAAGVSIARDELGLRVSWPYGIVEYTEDLNEPWREIRTEDFSLDTLPLGTAFFRHRTGFPIDPLGSFSTMAEWWQRVATLLDRLAQTPPPVDLNSVSLSTALDESDLLLNFLVLNATDRFAAIYADADRIYEERKNFLETHLRFDHTMPARFGLDHNNNGRMDLPNTKEYVYNVLPGESIPDEPTFDVALISSLDQGGPSHPFYGRRPSTIWPDYYRYRWKVRKSELGAPILHDIQTAARSVNLVLPAGRYSVELTASDSRFPFIKIEHTISREILVKDFLIVALGDSVISGEGNPELFRHEYDILQDYEVGALAVKRHKIWWADDGVTSSTEPQLYYQATPFFVAPFVGPIKDGTTDIYWRSPTLSSALSAVEKQHMEAHRSTVSWAAQAALDLERRSARSSVTFVSLAASGATLAEGVLGSKRNGSEDDTYTFPPQIEQLTQLIGGRVPDLVLLSVGANDIGFSQIVKVLMLYSLFPDAYACLIDPVECVQDEVRQLMLWNAIYGGDFPAHFPSDDNDGYKKVSGVDGLAAGFEALGSKLSEIGVNPLNVVITQYPQLFSGGDGQICDEALTAIVETLWNSNYGRYLTRAEMTWATDQVLPLLNETIRLAAADEGWTLADTVSGRFFKHGICIGHGNTRFPYAGNPYPRQITIPTDRSYSWIRAGKEAQGIQGPYGESAADLFGFELAKRLNTSGVLHPTDLGHQAIKEEVFKAFARRELNVP